MTPFLNNPTEPTEAFRILIVEDEAIVAESLKDQLVNLGIRSAERRLTERMR